MNWTATISVIIIVITLLLLAVIYGYLDWLLIPEDKPDEQERQEEDPST